MSYVFLDVWSSVCLRGKSKPQNYSLSSWVSAATSMKPSLLMEGGLEVSQELESASFIYKDRGVVTEREMSCSRTLESK